MWIFFTIFIFTIAPTRKVFHGTTRAAAEIICVDSDTPRLTAMRPSKSDKLTGSKSAMLGEGIYVAGDTRDGADPDLHIKMKNSFKKAANFALRANDNNPEGIVVFELLLHEDPDRKKILNDADNEGLWRENYDVAQYIPPAHRRGPAGREETAVKYGGDLEFVTAYEVKGRLEMDRRGELKDDSMVERGEEVRIFNANWGEIRYHRSKDLIRDASTKTIIILDNSEAMNVEDGEVWTEDGKLELFLGTRWEEAKQKLISVVKYNIYRGIDTEIYLSNDIRLVNGIKIEGQVGNVYRIDDDFTSIPEFIQLETWFEAGPRGFGRPSDLIPTLARKFNVENQYRPINLVCFTHSVVNKEDINDKLRLATTKQPILMTMNIIGKVDESLLDTMRSLQFHELIRTSYSKLNINFSYEFEANMISLHNEWLNFSPSLYTVLMAGSMNPMTRHGGLGRVILSSDQIHAGLNRNSQILLPEDDLLSAMTHDQRIHYQVKLQEMAEYSLNYGFDHRNLGDDFPSPFFDAHKVARIVHSRRNSGTMDEEFIMIEIEKECHKPLRPRQMEEDPLEDDEYLSSMEEEEEAPTVFSRRRRKAPPPPLSTPPSEGDESKDTGLSGGAIAGIVIGCVIATIGIGAGAYWYIYGFNNPSVHIGVQAPRTYQV